MSPSELGDWILNGMSSHASDARDKIFAFFGLAEDPVGWGLVADYGLSVEQVYTGIAAYLIDKGRIWDILKRAQCDRADEDGKPLDLPTWVPDFRREAPDPLRRWLTEIKSQYQPRLPPGPARPTQVLRKTGSLVVHGHRLLKLPHVGRREDPLLLELRDFGIRFLLEEPLKETDCFFFPRLLQRPDAPPFLLHIRKMDSPYAFTLVGRCIFQIERDGCPALSFPANSIADDMLPLQKPDFDDLWTVYRFLWSIRGDIAELRSHWGSSQRTLSDSETAWRDYQRLCASPPELPDRTDRWISRQDMRDGGLEDVFAFREFWEDTARVKIGSNWSIIYRLAWWVSRYDDILSEDRRPRYLELFKTWKESETEARSVIGLFLDAINRPGDVESDRNLAVQKINSWKDTTLELLKMISSKEEGYSIPTLLKVVFSSHLYPRQTLAEPMYELADTPEYPPEDGFIMYLHEVNTVIFGLHERIGKLPNLQHIMRMFDGMRRTLEEGGENLIRFCNLANFTGRDGALALLGNWKDVGEWFWLPTALNGLPDEVRPALKKVLSLKEKFAERAKWRFEVGLGWGEEETLLIV